MSITPKQLDALVNEYEARPPAEADTDAARELARSLERLYAQFGREKPGPAASTIRTLADALDAERARPPASADTDVARGIAARLESLLCPECGEQREDVVCRCGHRESLCQEFDAMAREIADLADARDECERQQHVLERVANLIEWSEGIEVNGPPDDRDRKFAFTQAFASLKEAYRSLSGPSGKQVCHRCSGDGKLHPAGDPGYYTCPVCRGEGFTPPSGEAAPRQGITYRVDDLPGSPLYEQRKRDAAEA